MIASNRENKDDPKINHPLFTGGFGIRGIIDEYANAPSLVSALSLFNSASLEFEIRSLAYYGAPLADVEKCVLKAHHKKETHLPQTLEAAAIQAIRDRDVTLKDDKGTHEGMAERLMKLYSTLYPETYRKTLEQVRLATIEEQQEKEERERLNQERVKDVFEAFKRNDSSTDEAIETFKNWTIKTSAINRLQLSYLCLIELSNRFRELPTVDEKDPGGIFGVLAVKYIEMRKELDLSLPPRMKRLTRHADILIPERVVDTDSSTASWTIPSTTKQKNFWNDPKIVDLFPAMLLGIANNLKTYYEQLQMPPTFASLRQRVKQRDDFCRVM